MTKSDGEFAVAASRSFAASALPGLALFAAALGLGAALFWRGLESLVAAWSIPEYSHGPIIPLISLFLFLREMRGVPPTAEPVTDRWPGLVVLTLGGVMGVAGNFAGIAHVVTYGFIVWCAGLVLVMFGLRRGAMFWPAVLHLVFMLPLPTFIYWEVSSFLQTVSSQLGVAVIAALGIPVFLDGNIIDLGIYKLQVAEACSGLRYLFPMLSFSYVFAVLYQGPTWHKVVLLLSAAPITVLMNSFRIGVIGVMVNNFGIEHAEGFLHTFEGWIIFLACVLILFGLAATMQRLSASPRPLSETIDVEFTGLDQQLRRALAIPFSRGLAAAVVLTGAVLTAWIASPERGVTTMARDPFVLFPRTVGGWQGAAGPLLDPTIESVLGADDYHSARFASPEQGEEVDLFMAYYHDQMDGTGIHSPEVCIPAGGWEVSEWSTETTSSPVGDIAFNRAIIQKGVARQLVYFWFSLRGQHIASDFEAKWINLRDSLTQGRSDGALVRLITPIAPSEEADAADARLREFIDALTPALPDFIPN